MIHHQFDSVVLGHVSRDINTTYQGNTTETVGGAVICAAAAAASLGHSVAAVTAAATLDQELQECFPPSVQRVEWVPSPVTTSIRNVYFTEDQERRESTALFQGPQLTTADVPNFDTGLYHLAGLMDGDFAEELVTDLSERAKIAVDMQAFLRHRDPHTQKLEFRHYTGSPDLFARTHYLKVDTAEAQVLTGLSDRREMARVLQSWGSDEVMVTNAKEVLVQTAQGTFACPLRPGNLSGRTGRGDTIFAAYIAERASHGISESLLLACATVSLKMETPGPLISTREAIIAYRDTVFTDLINRSLEV